MCNSLEVPQQPETDNDSFYWFYSSKQKGNVTITAKTFKHLKGIKQQKGKLSNVFCRISPKTPQNDHFNFSLFRFFWCFFFKLCKPGLEFQFFIDLTGDLVPVFFFNIYISLFFYVYFPHFYLVLSAPTLQIWNIQSVYRKARFNLWTKECFTLDSHAWHNSWISHRLLGGFFGLVGLKHSNCLIHLE